MTKKLRLNFVFNTNIQSYSQLGIKLVPAQFQKLSAFLWGQLTDRAKQKLQHACQISSYLQSTDHLVKNCKFPQPAVLIYDPINLFPKIMQRLESLDHKIASHVKVTHLKLSCISIAKAQRKENNILVGEQLFIKSPNNEKLKNHEVILILPPLLCKSFHLIF